MPADLPHRPQDDAAGFEPPRLKVSVILIGHNQAIPLRRALSALEQSQERDTFEILLVDCASRDESPQLDATFPAIQLLRLPHHFGSTKALNIAIRTAKGDLLFFLSPDVEVAPDTISKLVARLEADTDAAAACPLLVDVDGRPVSVFLQLPTRENLAAVCRGEALPSMNVDLSGDFATVDYPGREALLVRKQLLAGMNYFDQRFGEYWADADLAMQLRRAGKRMRVYPSIRAVRNAITDPLAGDSIAARDRIVGAAALVAKSEGFLAGVTFRVSLILRALVSFRFGDAMAVLSGQKLDGSQFS